MSARTSWLMWIREDVTILCTSILRVHGHTDSTRARGRRIAQTPPGYCTTNPQQSTTNRTSRVWAVVNAGRVTPWIGLVRVTTVECMRTAEDRVARTSAVLLRPRPPSSSNDERPDGRRYSVNISGNAQGRENKLTLPETPVTYANDRASQPFACFAMSAASSVERFKLPSFSESMSQDSGLDSASSESSKHGKIRSSRFSTCTSWTCSKRDISIANRSHNWNYQHRTSIQNAANVQNQHSEPKVN